MSGNKLSTKAARLDFSRLPGSTETAPPAAAAEARPKTAPGAMMAFATDARSELMRENEQLRGQAAEAVQLKGKLQDALAEVQQWEGAKAARLIDPRSVVVSRFANRHELNYSGPEFAALRADIESAGGNVQPIKVRRLAIAGKEGAQYELVFGHRRHRACLELGLPVLAVIDNLDDKALFVEMDRENRARKDLSAWEQGTTYRSALQQGLFPSNRRLAEAIGVDLSAVGKALALADLPEEVVAAFSSPLDLQFRWAKPLADAVSTNREAVLQAARALRAQPVASRTPKQVFAALVAAGAPGVEPFHPRPGLTLTVDGQPAGTLAVSAKGEVQLFIRPEWNAQSRLPELAQLVESFLSGVVVDPAGGAEARRRRGQAGRR
jgi:ParB family transcriptional regulator, chromosome partitioning protein